MGILETLWAREQIRDRLYTYCHGIDQRDWKLVRSCFGNDHHHTHGKFSGTADEFIEYASGFLKEVASSHHCLLYTSPSPRDRTRTRMPSSA